MAANSSNIKLVIGIAGFGLALFAAGIELYRRRQMVNASTETQDEERSPAEETGENPQSPEAHLPTAPGSLEYRPSGVSQKNLVLEYFALVFALTVPFWLFGGKPLPVPVKLPASALAAFNPLIAAIILAYRQGGLMSVWSLFKRVSDYHKIKNKIWYLPALFLYPLITVLSYGVMRLAGLPLPDPQIPWLAAPVYFFVFFIFAIGEELGWTGYIFDPMQECWGALRASILLGAVWALFHLVPDIQNNQPADWILWQRLGTVAYRILIAWVYNNAGKSVFTAILSHTTNNLSWALFPNNGSHYDPFTSFMITLPVVITVILGWDSKTLRRYRFGKA